MRSKLFDTFGRFKVWQRPLNKGKGFCFEVREGNSVLFRTHHLHIAMMDAKAKHNAFWDEQARVLKELQANGEL